MDLEFDPNLPCPKCGEAPFPNVRAALEHFERHGGPSVTKVMDRALFNVLGVEGADIWLESLGESK